jgi:hypothetical protein
MLDESPRRVCCRDWFTSEWAQIGLAPDRPTALSVSGLGRNVLACFEHLSRCREAVDNGVGRFFSGTVAIGSNEETSLLHKG